VNAAAGTSSATFAVALNDIVTPFSKTGAVGVSLPNIVAAGINPQFLKNILFNGTTNTGIYNQFRVWSCAASVTYTTGNAADSCNTAMVPLTTAASGYTTFEAVNSGPNSVSGASTFGSNAIGSTIMGLWSLPALQGVPKSLYPAFASSIGTFAATPGLPMFLQISYRTDNNNDLTATLGIRVQLQYHVEFFARVDGAALI